MVLEEPQGPEGLGPIRSVLDQFARSRVFSTYLLIRSTLGCGRKLTGGQIMFLASSNGVGLASFENGVACVRVGLDLVRGRRQQVGGERVGFTRSYQGQRCNLHGGSNY